jgi:lipopolysaccharide heptosyltransferase II
MTAGDDWAGAVNILAIRLDSLGDVLMTGPALSALKRARPGRRLTLLTSATGATAGSLIPEVDEVLVHDAPWMKAAPGRHDSQSDVALVECLRERRFDAAVIFTVFSQNPLPAAYLCYLADVPRRLAHCRENPYQLLTHWIAEPEPEKMIRHEVRRQLDLVAEVSCPGRSTERLLLNVPLESRRWAVTKLRSLGIPVETADLHSSRRLGRWAVVHPGASAASRRYPVEYFAAAARELVTRHDVPVLFTGTEAERGLVRQVRDLMGAPSAALVGDTRLAELAAVISLAPVIITNNTGPAHIAAAVGTPVVDLYALTNPQHTPWGVPSRVLFHDVPCKFCYRSVCPELHHDCLRKVSPQAVVRAALELLDDIGRADREDADRESMITHSGLCVGEVALSAQR